MSKGITRNNNCNLIFKTSKMKQKKNKSTSISISDNLGAKFTLKENDFFYLMDETIIELQENKRGNDYHREQRERLLETYFTYMFFAREFGWNQGVVKCYKPFVGEYSKHHIIQ